MKLKPGLVFASLLTALVLVMAVVGYSWLNQKKQEGFPGKRETVRIAIPREPLNALLIIAVERDFFSQEGLHVVVKEEFSTGTGKRALEGLLAGKLDIATSADTAIVFTSFKNQDFRIVASHGTSDSDAKIVGRKDRGIRAPSDLRGKRIGTPIGTIMHFFLHTVLVNNGLTEKDATLVFKNIEELPAALASGAVDAISIREPYTDAAQRLLGENAIVFSLPGLYTKIINVVANVDCVEGKPWLIKRIIMGLLKAEEFAKKNPGQAIQIVSDRLVMNKVELSAIWPELNLKVSLDQQLLLSLEEQARWAIKNRLTDKKQVPNYLNLIHLDALREARPEAVTIIR